MASRPQAPSNQPTAGTIKSYSIKVGNAEARQRQYFCGRFDTKKPTWLRTGGTHEPTVAKETLDNWEKRGARTAGMFAARVKAKPWHLTDCKGEEFIGRYMGDGTVAAAGPTQVGMKKNAGARFYVFAEQSDGTLTAVPLNDFFKFTSAASEVQRFTAEEAEAMLEGRGRIQSKKPSLSDKLERVTKKEEEETAEVGGFSVYGEEFKNKKFKQERDADADGVGEDMDFNDKNDDDNADERAIPRHFRERDELNSHQKQIKKLILTKEGGQSLAEGDDDFGSDNEVDDLLEELRQEQALEDEAEKIAPNSAVTPASAIQNKKRKGEELDATASPSKKPKNDATAALAAQAAPGSGAGVIGVLSVQDWERCLREELLVRAMTLREIIKRFGAQIKLDNSATKIIADILKRRAKKIEESAGVKYLWRG